jgi:ribosomal protein S18 acetylase RimI-like enzyme
MADIRAAGENDLDAIRRLEMRCFTRDAQSHRSLRYLLTRAHAAVWVAQRGGAIVAYAALLFRRGARSARLYSIAVDPEARGAGAARALLTAAEEEALARGCRRLRAEARKSNTASRQLFAAAGYREMAVLPAYYPGGESGIRLQKDLGRKA